MAPYQHVHLRRWGPHLYASRYHDDDDSVIIHIHLYGISLPRGAASDLARVGDHVAQALDTFKAVVGVDLFALSLAISQGLLSLPGESQEEFAELVEACGHDPPVLDSTIPRAPPA